MNPLLLIVLLVLGVGFVTLGMAGELDDIWHAGWEQIFAWLPDPAPAP